MKKTYFTIKFGVHVPESSVTSMVSGINSFGILLDTGKPYTYELEIIKESKVNELKQRLLEWERYGFLKWSSVEK